VNRSLPAAVGLVAVLLGLAGVVVGLTGPFSLTEAFVTVVGLLALVQGVRYALERRSVDRQSTDLGEPERRYRPPTPGDDFDRRTDVSRLPVSSLRRVRTRLHDAAVASMVAQGLSTGVAEDRIETGEWTDDPVAASFLRAGPTPVPLRDRIRAILDGRPIERVRAARTVDAIVALWEDEP
jgi:hypothetical protein